MEAENLFLTTIVNTEQFWVYTLEVAKSKANIDIDNEKTNTF